MAFIVLLLVCKGSSAVDGATLPGLKCWSTVLGLCCSALHVASTKLVCASVGDTVRLKYCW